MTGTHISEGELISEIRRLRVRLGELEKIKIEKKRLDYILKTSEDKYRAIIESQTDLVCRYLPDATLTFVNDAYCRYFGRSREELLGASFLPFVVNENEKKKIERNYRKITPEHPVIMYDGPTRMPESREEHWQHWSNKGIFDESGTLIEIQSVGMDITERKRAELALQESEKQFRLKKEQLEHKNIALAEIMEQIGFEKNKIKEDIGRKTEEVLQPVLDKMKTDGTDSVKDMIPLFERTIHGLAGSLGGQISSRGSRLSPREAEVGKMVKSGFSTKEIARILNLSTFTVQGHRSSIRRKFNIVSKKMNLATFLQSV